MEVTEKQIRSTSRRDESLMIKVVQKQIHP